MGAYLGVFLASAGAVAVVTPLVRRLAARFGAIDQPSDRKVHPKPTPTGGGVGILIGVAAGMAAAALTPSLRSIFRESSELQGTLAAAAILTAVGLRDDVRGMTAPVKLAAQILAAGVLILFGVELLFFWFPTQGVVVVTADLAVPLTVVWVLLIVNAVNLMDGLDGLAPGIVVIAAAAFFVYLSTAGASSFPGDTRAAQILSAVTAGAALGFLPYNFYPARIFMGDSGSMPLGLLLAAATISGVGRTLQPSGGDIAAFSIPVLIPMIVLAVPLADVALAVIRRLRRGRPVFAPDKEHIHHQLREIGNTHRRTVLIIYFWSILAAGSGLAITFINGREIVGAIVAGAVVLICATFLPQRLRALYRARRARKLESGTAAATVGTKSP